MSAYNMPMTIAVGLTSRSKTWKNKEITWGDFVARLSESVVKSTTLREFINSAKEEQHLIKDVGGYVGGYLKGGRRKVGNVVYRQLLTLDVDFATLDFFEDYRMLYNNAAFIHGTHKHCEEEPRYRLLIPLDRECSPDEYVAVGRRVAGSLGIDKFDNTTFEAHRLMFWPSHPKDVEYFFDEQKGPALDVDKTLDTYADWRDTSLWPTADKKLREIGEAAKKQEDPREKRGVVGVFCRTYTIQDAIASFLPDEYEPAEDGRYTYTKGSTSCGVVIYDDTFAFSHHGTDPISGKLCNAFDLVRIHLFGHLDENEKSNLSYAEMERFIMKDEDSRKTIARERLREARDVFGDDDSSEAIELPEEDFEWMSTLEIDSKGGYLSTAQNLNSILQNDPNLKKLFCHNEFDGRRYIMRAPRWRKRKIKKPEPIRNVDFSGVRSYIECVYKITSQNKIDDALALDAERNCFHPIRDYLRALEWDGVPRIDGLMIDYFGAADNIYTREAVRKTLVGAVTRVMKPGCKFDTMLVIVDPEQGIGKSTFVRILGGEWFSDTFTTFSGKEAFEQIQGAWLVEIGELAAMKKAEVELVKLYVAKQDDRFRPAYGRTPETYLRQNVFIGTSNTKDFLKDPTGNRRFLPIDVRHEHITRIVFDDLADERDQIWAEAFELYKAKEPLILSKEADIIAKAEQRAHSETDERTGIIMRYLEMPIPKDWKTRDVFDRRNYIDSDVWDSKAQPRQFVCTAEIWCECLGKDKDNMSRYNTREINDIMRTLPGWKGFLTTKDFGPYGTQKYYKRVRHD